MRDLQPRTDEMARFASAYDVSYLFKKRCHLTGEPFHDILTGERL